MTYLLDVNVLLSGIWSNHPLHRRVSDGIRGKSLAVCPLVELGFIRISTDISAGIRVGMDDARKALKKFLDEEQVQRVDDDLPALESHPKTSKEVTDSYLAALAGKHGFKLITMDARIQHPAVALI